jgi:hypothetical protein
LGRPILSLWPYLWRALLPVAIAASVAFVPAIFISLVCLAGVSLLPYAWRYSWLWRLIRRVRRFGTASDGQIVLHYAPVLSGKRDMSVLLRQCQAELDYLVNQFGRPLRGRVVVFVFATHRDVARTFGPEYGGTALPFANAIVIAHDNITHELIRHELAHLFSARWSALAPPLLREGLSVWLQGTECGQPIDVAARPLLGNRNLNLASLLKPKFFFDEAHRQSCYVLAGSFTGFLIRRYGWREYRKLFRLCNGVRFRAKFKKCFGVSLEKAEWQWRNEILVMEVLNRRLRRDRCL